jgi:crossover junction endodeoxyribonuclease RuvC
VERPDVDLHNGVRAMINPDPIRYILGVDPGLSGALAYYTPDHASYITCEDMPVVAKTVNAAILASRIRQMRPCVAVVEIASTRPGLSSQSVLKTGTGYGVILGVLAALEIPTHLVTPQTWKKHFRLDATRTNPATSQPASGPSSPSASRASRTMGRAEACLMARWYAETQGFQREAAE